MTTKRDPRDDASFQDAPSEIREALKSAKRIEDTLPPPEELVRKKQSVTIRLDADIVEWFKQQGSQPGRLRASLAIGGRRPFDRRNSSRLCIVGFRIDSPPGHYR